MSFLQWVGVVTVVSSLFTFVIQLILSSLQDSTPLNQTLSNLESDNRVKEEKIRIGNLVIKEGVVGCTGCIYYAGMGECKEGRSIKPCTRILLDHKITCVILEEIN